MVKLLKCGNRSNPRRASTLRDGAAECVRLRCAEYAPCEVPANADAREPHNDSALHVGVPLGVDAPTMPQEAISALAHGIGQGRRLGHVLGQPDDAASLAEGDQRSVELVWREVQGIAAPPVPIAPPKPRADCDVSLAVSVAYLHPHLAVGASRPGGHLFEQLRDSVKFESHAIKSCLTRLEPGRVSQAGARGFSAHCQTLLSWAIVPIFVLGEGRCERRSNLSDHHRWFGNDRCFRSEERRVGKECRSRWAPYP